MGARNAIRKLKSQNGLNSTVRVVLADGIYRLEETFELSHRDSGSADFPIVYEAAPDARPVISGGRKIDNWVKEERGLWGAEIGRRDPTFKQLFVDGRRATRARTPNTGFLRTDGPLSPIEDRNAARQDWGTL